MLGSQEIFSRSDGLLIEHLGAVVIGLGKLDLGCRGATSILGICERLEIIGLGLIQVSRFKIGQLLPFLDLVALACVKTHEPPFMNGADTRDAVLRNEDLPRGQYRPGNDLWGDSFGLDRLALRWLRRRRARLIRGIASRSPAASTNDHDEKQRNQEDMKFSSVEHIGNPFANALTFAESLRSPSQGQAATPHSQTASGNNWQAYRVVCGSHRATQGSRFHLSSTQTPSGSECHRPLSARLCGKAQLAASEFRTQLAPCPHRSALDW